MNLNQYSTADEHSMSTSSSLPQKQFGSCRHFFPDFLHFSLNKSRFSDACSGKMCQRLIQNPFVQICGISYD